jgi:hypothetical protein
MKEADDEVRSAEEDGVVSEGARHRQGDPEHRRRRAEHGQPDEVEEELQRGDLPGSAVYTKSIRPASAASCMVSKVSSRSPMTG